VKHPVDEGEWSSLRHGCVMPGEGSPQFPLGGPHALWRQNISWTPKNWPSSPRTHWHSEPAPHVVRSISLCVIFQLTGWPLNYCWPSPAQSFLVPSPTGFMTISYCLTALRAFGTQSSRSLANEQMKVRLNNMLRFSSYLTRSTLHLHDNHQSGNAV
jgi:hypothetical protein